MKVPLTAGESDRLQALRAYGALDAASECAFDDIVRLATQVCETPAGMITFLDESRQWFKSQRGLPFTETARELSFCAHAILEPGVLVVPDATQDARFADNPLVTGAPHIRFYAGTPLASPEGFALGTLAVIDFTPRHPTPEQLNALAILSRQVVLQLELRRHIAQEQRHLLTAEASLDTAATRLRAMFDSALDGIITMDASGRVTEFNAAAEALFGYRRTEAVGRLLADLIIPPEYRDQHTRGMDRHLRTGESVILGRRIETTAIRRDGTLFPVELSIHRLESGDAPVFTGFIRDITERRQATRELQASEDRYRRQRTAMTSLIQDERLYHGELSSALRQITRTAAVTLDVARVSVWLYLDDQSIIRCLDLYLLADDAHSSGTELSAASVPSYFEAMARMEVIAANDAQRDPRTCEFTNGYLVPLGITSMLDARIHFGGALHGVLCLEHIGPQRDWTPEEQTFAVAAANLVSLALEGHQRRQAQEALITQAEILTAVTESLSAYVEREDWKEAFSILLRCARTLTNSEYGFVGVVVEGPALRALVHQGIVWDEVHNRELYEQMMRRYEEDGYLTFLDFNNLFGHAITTGQVVVANDPDRDPRTGDRPDGYPPMHNFLGVPIRGRHDVTGVIALANRPGGFGPEETSRIETLVRQAGGICESYRQRERARVQEEERRKVEAALRASDERLRMVARATNDAVWDWDLKTNALFVPEGFGKLFGDEGEQSESTLESWFARVHPDDQLRLETSLRAATEGGAQLWSDEYRFRRSDGTYATVFDRGYVLRDDDGHPVRMIGAMMDVTGRKQLEAQLRQSQKLEAVGQLAGGVAHDFNNILTIIQGHASLLLTDVPQSATTSDSIGQIAEAAQRGAGLTRQLLAFSRKQVLQTTVLEIDEVVGSMMRLLRRLLGEDITLRVVPSSTPAFVRADASMMEQVILNLAVNARDAMPAGGRLTLRTTIERIDADAMPVSAETEPGLFVHVNMTDSGCGIAADALPHIFEPFFTTKAVDRGTGLGLATVYGVVKQHKGWVAVRSVPGEGACFDVYLPAVDAPPNAPEARITERSVPGGNETVLIVEDEAPVRRLARVLLQRRGYTVLEAENGPAALAVWHDHKERIDLLLTDMVMPEGLSGLDLANTLLSEQRTLKVIVTSGYSVDLAGKELLRTDRVSFLAKPYSVPQLLAALRASLDSP